VLVAQSQASGDSLAKVLNEDVALLDQLVNYFACRRLTQVNGQTVFMAIVGLEVKIEALFGSVSAADCKYGPARIALVAFFELDDLGPHIGQQRRRVRALLKDRPINDPYAFEWCFHKMLFTTISAR